MPHPVGSVEWLEEVVPEAEQLVETLLAPLASRAPSDTERLQLEFKGLQLEGFADGQASALWRPHNRYAVNTAVARLKELSKRLLSAASV